MRIKYLVAKTKMDSLHLAKLQKEGKLKNQMFDTIAEAQKHKAYLKKDVYKKDVVLRIFSIKIKG